jgi:hypothetical protein
MQRTKHDAMRPRAITRRETRPVAFLGQVSNK